MRTPQIQRLSPIGRYFTNPQAVSISDNVVVRNRIDWIIRLPLSMHTLKEFYVSE